MPYTAPDIINVSAGTTSNNLSNITFSNSNGITFGLNASTLTASHNGLTSQSNQAVSAANGSFTFQTITFANSNGISFSTGTQGLFASHNGLTSQLNQAFSADASSTFQTLVFQDSNGVSFSNNAGSLRVTHGLQFTSNTSNITSNALNTSASRVINIVAATNNTGGGTASLSSNVSFSNANGATFYTSAGGAIALSYTVPAGGGVAISGGANSQSTGTVNFANSNGITFGLSNNGTMTASHNGLTTARASNDAVGLNTALTAGPLAWTVNSAGISLNAGSAAGTTSGFAGNLISGSMTHNTAGLNLSLNHPAWLTTARASNDAVGLNTAQSNVTWTVNSSGLSLDARGYAGTATTFNGANISGSITLNSNGLNLSLSGATAAPSPVNISAGTTSNNLGTIQFNNANGVSFGLDGSTITASVNAGGGGIAAAAGTQTGTSGTIVFSNSNNITFGMNNSSVVTASFNPINIGISNLGNTGGTTGTFDGANLQYIFVGEDGIRLSQSSNGSSVSLTIDRMPISTYIPYYPASTGAQTIGAQGVTSASAWFFPVSVVQPVYFNQWQQLMTASWVTSNAAYTQTVTHQFGLFSNNAGTLSLMSSSSYSVAITGSSVSATLSYPSAFGTAGGYTYTTVAATTTAQAQSLFGTAGNRIMTFGFSNTMSLSEGLYWLGIHQRQTTAGANGGMAFALAGNVMAAAQNAGPLGNSTAAFTGTANTAFKVPWGVATSTGSAGYGGSRLPDAVNITAMGMTVTQIPMMTLISV